MPDISLNLNVSNCEDALQAFKNSARDFKIKQNTVILNLEENVKSLDANVDTLNFKLDALDKYVKQIKNCIDDEVTCRKEWVKFYENHVTSSDSICFESYHLCVDLYV